MLDLHTPRQLVASRRSSSGSRATSEPRPCSLPSGWRSCTPSCPPAGWHRDRAASPSLRMAGGHVRLPHTTEFRERNPWLAFEEASGSPRLRPASRQRAVRPRPGAVGRGPPQPRRGERHRRSRPCRSRRACWPSATGRTRVGRSRRRRRASASSSVSHRCGPTSTVLRPRTTRPPGCSGARRLPLLPLEGLAETSLGPPWSWQAAAIGRSLDAVAPAMARDGRVVLLVDRRSEPLVAAVLGGSAAGYRLLDARRRHGRRRRDAPASSNCCRRAGSCHPGRGPAPTSPSTLYRAVPATRTSSRRAVCSRPPERVDRSPVLGRRGCADRHGDGGRDARARGASRRPSTGCSARSSSGSTERDSCGASPMRRFRAATRTPRAASRHCRRQIRTRRREVVERHELRRAASEIARGRDPSSRPGGRLADRDAAPGVVERLIGLIRDELGSIDSTATDRDRARPLVASSIPTTWQRPRCRWRTGSSGPSSASCRPAGPLHRDGVPRADRRDVHRSRPARERPRPGLPRQLSEPREHARPARRQTTSSCGRSQEHTELLALIAEAGHRLGMRVWIGRREQIARIGRAPSATSSVRPRTGHRSGGSPAPATPSPRSTPSGTCGGRSRFLFEVEWTAMLGEPLLRRHAPDPARRRPDPLPRDRARADGARPLQDRPLAALARSDE